MTRQVLHAAPPKSVSHTYNEVKIGNTIYRLTSKFEGGKNLDETLKRLAVKRVTSASNPTVLEGR